jgi:hypothetical protein
VLNVVHLSRLPDACFFASGAVGGGLPRRSSSSWVVRSSTLPAASFKSWNPCLQPQLRHPAGRFDRVENYFGTNYPRLQQIKKKYDPDNVFFNSLSVKPARR